MATYLSQPESGQRPSSSKKGDRDLISEARKRYDRAYERERDNISAAYEDMEFRAGNQWDEKDRKKREEEGRPCITINRVPAFIKQVTGDMRLSRPSVKVVPVDNQSDDETAETLAGLVRYIENRSEAQSAYANGADSQVTAGVGAWRVTSEYASEKTFEQELRVKAIDDAVSIVWDPDACLPTREDAQFCFVPYDLSRDRFKELYPNANAEAFGEDTQRFHEEWFTEDYVRVAEYWFKVKIKRRLAVMPSGEIYDLTDMDEDDVNAVLASGPILLEERDGYRVKRAIISWSEVLEEPQDWPGSFIPIVPALGEEVKIGRRVVRHGLVRFMRDPARTYNYFRSQQTEVVALQPKAPWIGTERMFEKYQGMWETANSVNYAYLVYEPDPEAPGAAPQRVSPPVSSQGVSEGLGIAADELKAITGIHDAGLGARSNETSGRAIEARQRESDVGTYVYLSNYAMAIRHTGRILVDLIPKIYDTQRTIRILGDDGQIDRVELNKPIGMDNDGQPVVLHDVTRGAYDVVLEAGPSFTTRREEAKEGMTAMLQSAPDLAPIMVDLIAEAQDWPNKSRVAKRARMLLPPAIAAMEAEESGEPIPQPPPDPQAQAEMQKMQAEMQRDQAQNQVEREKIAVDRMKAEVDYARIAVDAAQVGLDLPPLGQSGDAAARLERVESTVANMAQALDQIMQAIMPAQAPDDMGAQQGPMMDGQMQAPQGVQPMAPGGPAPQM